MVEAELMSNAKMESKDLSGQSSDESQCKRRIRPQEEVEKLRRRLSALERWAKFLISRGAGDHDVNVTQLRAQESSLRRHIARRESGAISA